MHIIIHRFIDEDKESQYLAYPAGNSFNDALENLIIKFIIPEMEIIGEYTKKNKLWYNLGSAINEKDFEDAYQVLKEIQARYHSEDEFEIIKLQAPL